MTTTNETQSPLPVLETTIRDVRYALRRLRKTPGFTAIALLTLALGIGANTGIFTLLNAVLLKSLPVPHPEQLFLVKQGDQPADESLFSYPLFQRVRQQSPDSGAIAAMSWADSYYVAAGSGQEQALGQLVSGNYFQVFQTYPTLGRLLEPTDDTTLSGNPVAVISYTYWLQHFGGDPNVIGHKLQINGLPFSIIGVSARGFFGARPGSEPDFWMPLTMQPRVRFHGVYSSEGSNPSQSWIPQEKIEWLQFIARVRNSAVIPKLLAVIDRQYRDRLELLLQNQNQLQRQQALARARLTLEPGQRGFATLRRQFTEPLFLLMGMAAMVLLIACANIANLLLARAGARARAYALQLSMGASQMRLVLEVLTECVLLSIGGAILGIAFAFWCTKVLPRWASSQGASIPLNLRPDAHVLLFSLLVAVGTGILFGMAPALRSTRIDPASAIKGSAANIAGYGSTGGWSLRKVLVACQVSLSLVLLVGTAMFLRTLMNYSKLNPGFDVNHVLSVHLNTHLVGYKRDEYLPLYERLIQRVKQVPGISFAAVATCSLSDNCPDATDVKIGSSGTLDARPVHVQFNRVSPDYFQTVGTRLVMGRVFERHDDAAAPGVAVVNQTFARRFLKGGDPVGQWFFSRPDDGPDHFEIVGMVKDARVNDIREPAPPIVYFPVAQHPGNIDSLEIRTAADPQWIQKQVRQAIDEVDYRLPIVEIIPLSEQVARNLTQERLISRVTLLFGLIALALACLGLFGVVSYTVQRRTNEIGVRLALGFTPLRVLWLILKETLFIIAGGAAFGLLLAIIGTHLARRFLFGLSPEDPFTIGLATGVLFAVSIMAGLAGARKATSIDPAQALRAE